MSTRLKRASQECADPLLDLAKIDCCSIRGDDSRAAGLAAGYGIDFDAVRPRFDLYRV